MLKLIVIFLLGELFTTYIIFDLEFNSVKIPNTDRHINEIIEIGAVKLDRDLKEIDSFTSLVNPLFSQKLNKYFKSLTNINEEQLKNASDFKTVIKKFINWCRGDDETVFLTWSDTDLHVLFENYSEILKLPKIDFIKKYTDLQKYIQIFIKTENHNQISLKSAAEFYKISTENFALHRAEDDSRVCACLLNNTYNEDLFNKHIQDMSKDGAFKRFAFKPYIISDLSKLKENGINKDKLYFSCPVCGEKNKFTGKFNPKIKAFSNIIKCKDCKRKIAVSFCFKKTFDSVNIKKRTKEFIKKKKYK